MDFYKILGIDNKASQEEIKKQYRKLSLKMHPDKGGDINKFKELNEAYQTLGDENKRKEYDFKRQFNNNNSRMPQDIFNMMFSHMNNMSEAPFFNFSQPSNINNHSNIRIFRNGLEQQNVFNKPTPIIKTIEITLEESYNGIKKPINIERWVKEDNIKRIEKETIYIDIPRGIDNNEIIILRDKGNIISEKNKGDIKLFIKVNNTSYFERRGIDLILKKKISLKEALCGFSFEIEYFNQRKFIIKNENNVITPQYSKIVPKLGLVRDNQNGNLIIEFDIEFPNLDEEQINKLKEIL